jgi:hypothetical protein
MPDWDQFSFVFPYRLTQHFPELRRNPTGSPNVKLQELSRVDLELRSRNLDLRSRVDVQGFIWTSIQVEGGRYSGGE